MIGLEWSEASPEVYVRDPGTADEDEEDTEKNEVSRALQYMVKHALRFGRVKGFEDLLEQVAGYRQYRVTAAGRILAMSLGFAPRRDPYVSRRQRQLAGGAV